MSFKREPKTSYSVEYGAYVAREIGLGMHKHVYENVAEVGPYRTLRGARRVMLEQLGEPLNPDPHGAVLFEYAEPVSIILGATICAYTHKVGTYYEWDYDSSGDLKRED